VSKRSTPCLHGNNKLSCIIPEINSGFRNYAVGCRYVFEHFLQNAVAILAMDSASQQTDRAFACQGKRSRFE
jgi:hypothetical protein